ncbi:hypothetical protein DFQ27_004800 [Actinomortierella ambigua]|uniref:Alpha-N-acetylglucosaminidase n=1 Tax=Actinomortierella ambigua TaxID=1343610 RepID=A0A9P6Q4S3_9FUNG|nr:hypothetical protein DFQ27_004800 [Actinomortierella ambigua]
MDTSVAVPTEPVLASSPIEGAMMDETAVAVVVDSPTFLSGKVSPLSTPSASHPSNRATDPRRQQQRQPEPHSTRGPSAASKRQVEEHTDGNEDGEEDMVRPLYDLVKRRLPPTYHDAFTFVLKLGMEPVEESTSNVYDAYKVSQGNTASSSGANSQEKILIEAATLSGLGVGLNHYLKHVCQVEMTWSGDRFVALPPKPPMVPIATAEPSVAGGGEDKGGQRVLSGSSFVQWRYYMNVVTFGYSFAFWDWKRWEKELDWMMLNGVNMGLAMVGQEQVLRQFYLDLGLTEQEILGTFLAGPAFTPWQRMGNLQGSWGHDATRIQQDEEIRFKRRWYSTQWALQQRIVDRMRAFNITAVLPSFNGFVPQAMVAKYPQTKFEKASIWANMPEKYTRNTYVPSTDPLFTVLSQRFIELQKKMYNGFTSHYYLLDLYNELDPPCEALDCFTDVTHGVMKALKTADPEAIWVMQGWFLVNRGYWENPKMEAFFKGIKQFNGGQDVFVFDLYSDVAPLWNETQGYYGLPWGWSMLNNFGGSQGLYGTLPTLLTEPFEGYRHEAKSMRGMGITMEGINNNEYLYQLVLDLAWHRADKQAQKPINGAAHLNAFLVRRYGAERATPAVLQAWKKLAQTVWDCRTGQMSQSKTFLDQTPKLEMEHFGFMGTKMWYDRKMVVEAWGLLIGSTLRGQQEQQQPPPPSSSILFTSSSFSSFRYDLVDVTREVLLGIVLPALHAEIVRVYRSDTARLRTVSYKLLQVLDDTDRILGTHSLFMLGPWLDAARARAMDPVVAGTVVPPLSNQRGYEDYLEYNARNQITWWGPQGQVALQDYASKQWGGLIKTFYIERWELFVTHLQWASNSGDVFDEEAYLKASLERETAWQKQTLLGQGGRITVEERGDTVRVAQEIWRRWGPMAKKIANGEDIL